jgi:hypothetical protein
MTQEALKLALKALNAGEHAHLIMNTDGIKDKVRQAIAELESQERNFCERCGKRTNDIHTCTPPQRTEQEPVKLPCCGYTDASAVKWNPFSLVVQCHNCGQTYTQPQRTWVGLTNEELTDLFYNTNLGQQSAVSQAIALLKEKNT